MALIGKTKKIKENGQEKEIFPSNLLMELLPNLKN